jgi:hypothetical protein
MRRFKKLGHEFSYEIEWDTKLKKIHTKKETKTRGK